MQDLVSRPQTAGAEFGFRGPADLVDDLPEPLGVPRVDRVNRGISLTRTQGDFPRGLVHHHRPQHLPHSLHPCPQDLLGHTRRITPIIMRRIRKPDQIPQLRRHPRRPVRMLGHDSHTFPLSANGDTASMRALFVDGFTV
ncbi:MAG: hypothetical protein HY332_21490 [Chloroflexi bacterium]|nr:hypothetical protein [Chloroflexota bacterium]